MFLTTNTIMEFMFIMIGMILLIAVVAVIIEAGKKKTDDFFDKKKLETVEIFSSKEITNIDDLFRYAFGSPGETTRVLTKNYFQLFFNDKKKSKENMRDFLNNRNGALHMQEIGLSEILIEELSNHYKTNIVGAIFAIILYENSFQNNKYLKEEYYPKIFIVVVEEFNKIAPRDFKSTLEYDSLSIFQIKRVFNNHGIKLN